MSVAGASGSSAGGSGGDKRGGGAPEYPEDSGPAFKWGPREKAWLSQGKEGLVALTKELVTAELNKDISEGKISSFESDSAFNAKVLELSRAKLTTAKIIVETHIRLGRSFRPSF